MDTKAQRSDLRRAWRWPALAATLAAWLCALAVHPALAEDQQEATLLTVDNGQTELLYTTARLQSLPQRRLVTHTSVTDGPQVFEGPLMRDLLADAGVQSDAIRTLALNDYEIVIPTEDFTRFDVIAALTMNGTPLTPRDKGPVWIVYPRDDHDELQDIRYDYRWVWQLILIEAQ